MSEFHDENEDYDVEGHSGTVTVLEGTTFGGTLLKSLEALEMLSARIAREDGLEMPAHSG